jgi:glycosyltransferase involved in cell wall biosynthesis
MVFEQSTEATKLLIVMPAYDEETVIKSTIENIMSLEFSSKVAPTILVVDDGSNDATADIARSCGVSVISHPFNCGVGIALRSGFMWGSLNKFDAVIQIDADGQHPSEEIEELLNALLESEADIVIGSRFLKGDWDTTKLRRATMSGLAKLVSWGTDSKITDATSGFRISGPRAIKLFANSYPGEYLGDTVESLVLAHKHGLRIVEMSAGLRERQGGQASHLRIRSSLHVLRVFVMVFLRLSKPKSSSSNVGAK